MISLLKLRLAVCTPFQNSHSFVLFKSAAEWSFLVTFLQKSTESFALIYVSGIITCIYSFFYIKIIINNYFKSKSQWRKLFESYESFLGDWYRYFSWYYIDCPFFFQFPADSSSTLPYPLNMKSMKHEAESDGSDGIDSAGICVHESTQVWLTGDDIHLSKMRSLLCMLIKHHELFHHVNITQVQKSWW